MVEEFDPKTEYKCEACGGIFNKGWSDEEALAEYKENFPDIPFSETGLVCDECFNKMRMTVW
jgi:DNA-directed RNA polymerase subunit RPC12/RpoP